MAEEKLRDDAGKDPEYFAKLRCRVGWADEIHNQIAFLTTINIFLSFTAIIGNSLIIVALRKESSFHSSSKLMYRCLATTDLGVGLITEPSVVIYYLSLLHEDWNRCIYAEVTHLVASTILISVSLFVMTAISLDRLLALLLGLKYRQVVTLKRTCLLLVIFWIVSILVGISPFLNNRIVIWCGYIGMPLCLVTTTFSYIQIFYRLHYSQSQVQVHVPQQLSQPAPLNMTRYRKAVCSALWVQVALLICYLPFGIVGAIVPRERLSSSEFIAIHSVLTVIYLNSSLNPFLYCWKISEVRRAVKETLRQALFCA